VTGRHLARTRESNAAYFLQEQILTLYEAVELYRALRRQGPWLLANHALYSGAPDHEKGSPKAVTDGDKKRIAAGKVHVDLECKSREG